MTILPYNFCKVEKKLETLKWLWTPIISTNFFLTLLKLLVFLTEYSVAMVTYYTIEIVQSFNTNIVKSLDNVCWYLIRQSMTVGQF